MEKFSEFNKDNKFPETEIEKVEIKEIQVEEKKFFGKAKESAKNILRFDFVTKENLENFKKALRTITLATALSIPIGEKAFAERETYIKESPITAITQKIAQNAIDKEINKLEQVGKPEEFKEIIKLRQILKEKYSAEVVGKNSEYTLEELKDFDEVLEKVQKFAPEQFNKLKIAFVKVFSFDMKVFPNLFERVEMLEEIKNKLNKKYKEGLLEYKQKILNFNEDEIIPKVASYIEFEKSSRDLNFLITLVNLEEFNKYGTKSSDNYDIVALSHKKNMEKLEKGNIKYTAFSVSKQNLYKISLTHELSHLITLGNYNLYHKELANKFDNINKKISTESNKKITEKNGLERYQGFVSDYATSDKVIALLESGFRPKDYDAFYGLRNVEDIAETMTYMINDCHYADDDPIVQEKIKTIKEFLNKKENE